MRDHFCADGCVRARARAHARVFAPYLEELAFCSAAEQQGHIWFSMAVQQGHIWFSMAVQQGHIWFSMAVQ
jgi:hypothetical protein